MKKFGAMRLVRTTQEPRESLQDGAILIENFATKNWYRCDCGNEMFHWNRDIKGKELSLLTDCGCGILARQAAEIEAKKQEFEISVKATLDRPKMRLDGVGSKAMKAFNIELDLLMVLEEYAKQSDISTSRALCDVLRAGFKNIGDAK